ncbi:MAG: hypothetical protein M3O15_16340 [Acidobacteriota bacterium]|nr:hypothetical protein [Acidobacteriota bacterium]
MPSDALPVRIPTWHRWTGSGPGAAVALERPAWEDTTSPTPVAVVKAGA